MTNTTKLLTPSQEDIQLAAQILANKGLVSFGTETVYGLGANAYDDDAVKRIYEAKQRPSFNPLIHHFASREDAFKHALPDFPLKNFALEITKRFCPGPLTLIMPKNPNIPFSSVACAGLDTFAARVPDKKIAQDLIRAAGFPIVAPSANPSGKVSPTQMNHVIHHLGTKIDAIIDSGPCSLGLESTILNVSGDIPEILREGAITQEMISEVASELHITLKNYSPKVDNFTPIAPGALSSHYKPSLKVVLNQLTCNQGDAFLAFGEVPVLIQDYPFVFNLSETGNLEEAASNLYSAFHKIDELGRKEVLKRICVMPIPNKGVGRAINDRLNRAAFEKTSST